MRALSIDETGGPVLRDLPRPDANGEAIVRVRLAGICNTDLELTRGYMGFRGVPGHEFVGEVVESPDATLLGRRVVGEINAGCGGCDACAAGLARHCQRRSVLGILNRNGVHADCARLPAGNLHHVPDALSDEEAVFTEPLAAAYETLEMRAAAPGEQWLVLGDGKLGLLVAAALHADGAAPLLAGRHAEKLAIAALGRADRSSRGARRTALGCGGGVQRRDERTVAGAGAGAAARNGRLEDDGCRTAGRVAGAGGDRRDHHRRLALRRLSAGAGGVSGAGRGGRAHHRSNHGRVLAQ
jgi:threonine dehydrogenase-like Zn-dependent dehydrogenase